MQVNLCCSAALHHLKKRGGGTTKKKKTVKTLKLHFHLCQNAHDIPAPRLSLQTFFWFFFLLKRGNASHAESECTPLSSISIYKTYTQTQSYTHTAIQHTLHGSPLLNYAGHGVNGHSAATRGGRMRRSWQRGEAPELSFNYSCFSESHTSQSPHQECYTSPSSASKSTADLSSGDCSESHTES